MMHTHWLAHGYHICEYGKFTVDRTNSMRSWLSSFGLTSSPAANGFWMEKLPTTHTELLAYEYRNRE